MAAQPNEIQYSTQVALRVRQLAKQAEEAIAELNSLQSKLNNGDFNFSVIDYTTASGLGFVSEARLTQAIAAAQAMFSSGDFPQLRQVSAAG
jgi:hypothetical protein